MFAYLVHFFLLKIEMRWGNCVRIAYTMLEQQFYYFSNLKDLLPTYLNILNEFD